MSGAFWRTWDEIEPGHVAEIEADDEHAGMPGEHRGRGKQAFAAGLRLADEVELGISLDGGANGCTALDIIVNEKDINHFTAGSRTGPTGRRSAAGMNYPRPRARCQPRQASLPFGPPGVEASASRRWRGASVRRAGSGSVRVLAASFMSLGDSGRRSTACAS